VYADDVETLSLAVYYSLLQILNQADNYCTVRVMKVNVKETKTVGPKKGGRLKESENWALQCHSDNQVLIQISYCILFKKGSIMALKRVADI
jgi:hypothetical protein